MGKELDGEEWNYENQKKFQILLIKNRLYGFDKPQFYKNLSTNSKEKIKDTNSELTYEDAKKIFEEKKYIDPPMRGRQSMNALKKIGLVIIKNKKVVITELANSFIKNEIDIGDLLFRSFLKWQIPNPLNKRQYKEADGYNIKPFLGTLHLIKEVNDLCKREKMKAKGLSKKEFSLFCPMLINYKDINNYAERVINLRKKLEGKNQNEQKKIFSNYEDNFIKNIFNIREKKKIIKIKENLKDYGDNAIRYFRLTRFLYIRGGGFYVDLEPRRSIEINNLLVEYDASAITFETEKNYLKYLSDIKKPELPWETKDKLHKIAKKIKTEINKIEKKLGKEKSVFCDLKEFKVNKLKKYIFQLRKERKKLQEKLKYSESQKVKSINEYIKVLKKEIFKLENSSIQLEKYTTLSLYALDDALSIYPNYPIGDDGEPTFTAPAGKPDIECYYKCFNAICEVTMICSRNQWYYEGQPVMRHLRDFEERNKDKESYCLFLAPKLHRDTINTFWISVKFGYEGIKQKIIPMNLNNYVSILEVLLNLKRKRKVFDHKWLLRFYDSIISMAENSKNSKNWVNAVPRIIEEWKKEVLS